MRELDIFYSDLVWRIIKNVSSSTSFRNHVNLRNSGFVMFKTKASILNLIQGATSNLLDKILQFHTSIEITFIHKSFYSY